MKTTITRDRLQDIMSEQFPDYVATIDSHDLRLLFEQMFLGSIKQVDESLFAVESEDDNFIEIAELLDTD